MSFSLSPNTQAILLLTAPLIAGRATASADLLTPGEYKRLARQLRECKKEPADFLANDRVAVFDAIRHVVEIERLNRLLERGFLLSQAVERWQTRAIWVMSRADAGYPKRLKLRLKEDAPPILYGCGEPRILATGGLAVVGSRNVDDELIAYTEEIGRLAAAAQRTLVSGGARGIDQAAMRGALDGGGRVIGVLADSLERAAMNRGNRDALMNGQLVLISPYDPSAGFNVGHAMQRNKLIYSLADAALVVNSDFEKGGTWSGAVEQLDMPATMPVYVRAIGKTSKGLEALRRRGALPWPNPSCESELLEIFSGKVEYTERGVQSELSFAHEPSSNYDISVSQPRTSAPPDDTK
jgi:predicted Rossmann fold nucleotide-binding protein DprA/Smf involved in DNA uptake